MTLYPICETEIDPVAGIVEAELITCPDWGTELDVTSTNPFAFQKLLRKKKIRENRGSLL